MKRFLFGVLFAVLGASGLGCSPHVGGLLAEAPGTHLSTRISATGQYTLYRVDRFSSWGTPAKVTEVGSYDLQEGEHAGFAWEASPQSMNRSNGELNLIAYAGSNSQNLGPLTSREEKFYWAQATDWGYHWTWEPIARLIGRLTLAE